MDIVLSSIQEYVKSGSYFIDAKKWYKEKYISPINHRSYVFIGCIISITILLSSALHLYALFPIIHRIKYAVNYHDTITKSANIIKATGIAKNPTLSIADLMIRNYIINRECYDHDKINTQSLYVQNNSSTKIFKQFNNYMSINNAISPVMRYQKHIRRVTNAISIKQIDQSFAIVEFETLAKSTTGEILEDMLWEAHIRYDMDNFKKAYTLKSNQSKFNFSVTGYNLKLITNKLQDTLKDKSIKSAN